MYRLSYVDYAAMVSRLKNCADYFESEAIRNVVSELLQLIYDCQSLYIEVPERLMKAVAIINMCEMSIVQFRDSNGEIDYADCGEHSTDVLMAILHTIDEL
jgi:hypothetical protein